MNAKRAPFVMLCLYAGLGLAAGVPVAAKEFEAGKLIKKVACIEASGQSYALYLPSTFDRGRTWPILFLYDAGARGAVAVEAFRAAAETYGWILVGLNNSRNGPMQDNARAAWAAWTDVLKRLPLDERRVYAAGFSGGARVASVVPQVLGRTIAGAIGCGAGLSTDLKPETFKTSTYFGLTGLADFNYGEMKRLDSAFDPSGIPHRFLFFEGGHDWPDAACCARAVGWMEVMAMKSGLRARDEDVLKSVIGSELAEAQSFEDSGRVFWAVDHLEAVRRLAEGLHDIPGIDARIDALRSRKEYAQFLGDERKRDRQEADFRREFGRAFGAIENDVAGVPRAVVEVLKVMRIGSLRKDAKTEKTIEDRSLTSRLLFDFSFAAQSRAMELYGQDDLIRSAAYLDLAIAACEEGLPREKFLYLNRACIAALAGEKKRALDFLDAAVDKGYSDIEVLETTKELDSLRATEEFRTILERARQLKTAIQR